MPLLSSSSAHPCPCIVIVVASSSHAHNHHHCFALSLLSLPLYFFANVLVVECAVTFHSSLLVVQEWLRIHLFPLTLQFVSIWLCYFVCVCIMIVACVGKLRLFLQMSFFFKVVGRGCWSRTLGFIGLTCPPSIPNLCLVQGYNIVRATYIVTFQVLVLGFVVLSWRQFFCFPFLLQYFVFASSCLPKSLGCSLGYRILYIFSF